MFCSFLCLLCALLSRQWARASGSARLPSNFGIFGLSRRLLFNLASSFYRSVIPAAMCPASGVCFIRLIRWQGLLTAFVGQSWEVRIICTCLVWLFPLPLRCSCLGAGSLTFAERNEPLPM